MRQDARLAAAGAGQDQDRSVGRLDGPLLLGVEAAEDPLRERLGRGLPLGQRDRLGLERRRFGRLDTRAIEGFRRRLIGRRRFIVPRRRRRWLGGMGGLGGWRGRSGVGRVRRRQAGVQCWFLLGRGPPAIERLRCRLT
jgi:hypothetical protein